MNAGRYRLVRNRRSGLTIPAAEHARTRHRSAAASSPLKTALTAAGLLLSAAAIGAGPLPVPCAGSCGPAGTGFVSSGAATYATNGATKATITQATQQAILNWQSFNIGAGNSVQFVQPNASASALNRIYQADPSRIAGALSANGHIYLINQNGIIFDGSAQINVGSLTASTLNIQDSTYLNGVLSVNTNANVGQLGTPFSAEPGSENSVISVSPGAQLRAASGGRIMLLAPNVRNEGLISTPDGQTIIGAGTKVYLTASSDPRLRGLLIEVDNGGKASNAGQIIAERGNVTLTGAMVNQSGKITATTSVKSNGTVYLVAGDTSRRDPTDTTGQTAAQFYNPGKPGFGQLLPNRGGQLTLAAGSVTEVRPDTSDTSTITDTQSFLSSSVGLVGKNITLENGAAIVAPGGSVTLRAADNPIARDLNPLQFVGVPPNDSRIYLDSGSLIDVSGLRNVQISAERNLVEVELRSNELQDSPLQRDGFLRGKTVTVNLDIGTPLTDLTPYRNNIGRTVAEKMTVGGSISLDSEGDVITRSGSVLNVSGGSILYSGGYGHTTQLLGIDGRVYDIGTAPKDIRYVAFADSYTVVHSKWGVTETFYYLNDVRRGGGFLPSYVSGADPGRVDIVAPQLAIEGAILGSTVKGRYQRAVSTLPLGGTLVIGDAAQDITGNLNPDFRAPDITFSNSFELLPGAFDASTELSDARKHEATISTSTITQGGLGAVKVYSNGDIRVPDGTSVALGDNGTFYALGKSVTVAGHISVSTGAVSLKSFAGDTVLASGAGITARGNWVNDSALLAPAPGVGPILSNGGAVELSSAANVVLGAGSLIDVSGGGWVTQTGNLVGGSGGGIRLLANDSLIPGGRVLPNPAAGLQLAGELRAFGLSDGGTLSISSAYATIGRVGSGAPGEILLQPEFFSQGGFSTINVTGKNGVTIASGAQIRPVMQNLLFTQNYLAKQTGTDIYAFTRGGTLPDVLRAPVSITLSATATGVNQPGAGNLTMAAGSSIVTDSGGSVTLSARENLTVRGTIEAPAGRIVLQTAPGLRVGQDDTDEGFVAGQQLLVGSEARLLAQGAPRIFTNNALGYRLGTVLDGGSIEIAATKGYAVIEAGSVLDVSGRSAVVDLVPALPGTAPVRSATVAGAAGSIAIHAREGIVLNGDLNGRAAAVTGAAAGSLSIGLDLYDRSTDPNASILAGGATVPLFPTTDRNLTLTAANVATSPGPLQNGTAQISVSRITSGGFDSVEISSSDLITLDTGVNLSAKRSLVLDAPQLVGNPGASVQLSAAYVALGNSNGRNQPAGSASTQPSRPQLTPETGDAMLRVDAQLIDIRGNSTLSGFGSATYTSSGDIRFTLSTLPADSNSGTDFTGSLKTTADLIFQAVQVYPTTYTQFTINPLADGSYAPGSVRVLPNPLSGPLTRYWSPGAAPLSAGGSLAINAVAIEQAGVVRAPLGQITLNGSESVTLAPGSLTSVSADGRILPLGATQNGSTWTYLVDTTGKTTVIAAPPARQVKLAAPQINISPGARADLSGGGDLYAYEFIAGPGGSRDVLDATTGSYSFAILPGLGSAFAPLDHQYGLGFSGKVGDSVYLAGVPGLAPGYYALLPARYALLPGAFAVQPVSGYADIPMGTAVTQLNGTVIVAGRNAVAGTDIIDSRTSGFLITPSAIVRSQSQYSDSYASTLFANQAALAGTAVPHLPVDAGQLRLAAQDAITLDGIIDLKPGMSPLGKGRGGEVSIEAPRITVVDTPGAPDGTLQLSVGSLNQLGAQSLLLGATRTGDQLDVGASSVVLRNSAAEALIAPEMILAATQEVIARSGSAIVGKGVLDNPSRQLLVQGDGALLRVTSGPQAALIRSGAPQSPLGTLTIEQGASIHADGSVILDAASDTRIAPGASIFSRAVSISSSRVSIGDLPAGTVPPGLNLTAALLDGLTGLSQLTLRSYSSIDLYGAASVGSIDTNGAPVLADLTLEGWGLVGYGDGNKTLQAGMIHVTNLGAAACAPSVCAGTGTGSLSLIAGATQAQDSGRIILGAGDKNIAGFSQVALVAARDIQGQDTGALTLRNSGDLSLQAARIGTATGVDQQITNQTGKIALIGTSATSALADSGVGGSLTIAATSIASNGLIDLPAGIVALHATGSAGTGDITLGTGSIINVGGFARQLGDTVAYAAAGEITLTSDHGNVELHPDAVLDVSGAAPSNIGQVSGSDAGRLVVAAAEGRFNLGGVLKGGASAGHHSGSFSLDTFALDSLPSLDTTLASGGFAGSIAVRVRTGDINVAAGDLIKATNLKLAADRGNIQIAGTLDTSGGAGGTIALWAGTDLTLAPGASLLTRSTTTSGKGGDITLGSASGNVDLQAGADLDLRGDDPSLDGQLLVRAPRTGDNHDVQVNPLAGSIHSSQRVVVEAVRAYDIANPTGSAATLGGTGTLSTGNLSYDPSGPLFSDTRDFALNAQTAAQRLAQTGAQIEVRPGVEVRSSGNLDVIGALNLRAQTTVQTGIDPDTGAPITQQVDNWRVGGVPINLTLRAGGTLTFKTSLSDGFATSGTQLKLLDGSSASYRLIAGADLGASSPLALQSSSSPLVSQGSGNLILTPGNLVRTGAGSIDIAAAGDVRLGYDPTTGTYNRPNAQASVIYTAGVPSVDAASFPLPTNRQGQVLAAAYPTDGGNITITAGRDVTSAPSSQLISNWLWRRGTVTPGGTIVASRNTSWWIAFDQFQQGVGALGGGDVTVNAGRDITNLSAVIPTTGRLSGTAGSVPQQSNLIIQGGGNLEVHAGGDIRSGLFQVDRGTALLTAGGSVTSGRVVKDTNTVAQDTRPVFPILALANGSFDVRARKDVVLDAVVNPPSLSIASAAVTTMPINAAASYFYTYTPSSAVSMTSAAGDVHLNNNASAVLAAVPSAQLAQDSTSAANLSVYPGNVDVAALSGSIDVGPTSLFPSSTGNLTLLARGDVRFQGAVQVYESDPTRVASPLAPVSNLRGIGLSALPGRSAQIYLDMVPLPLQPLHAADGEPILVVADSGSIVGDSQPLVFPKQSRFYAGVDITDLRYEGKNLTESDVTSFEAGRDIVFAVRKDSTTNQLQTNFDGVKVGGPGQIQLLAGRNIDLGNSRGVDTRGNLDDVRLPAHGAQITVATGLGVDAAGGPRAPDYATFITRYILSDGSAYSEPLRAYVSKITGATDISLAQAQAAFRSWSQRQQLPFVAQVLYAELRATALEHNATGAGYERGYAAIATLFPNKDYRGDLNLFFSQLKTEQGGDINMLVPGGNVIVGLANPPQELSTLKIDTTVTPNVPAAGNLGILVFGEGAVRGFAQGNFNVNRSRVLTLQGGDILLWSSEGNIDAGKGAKTASAAPPPVIQTDANGNVFINPGGSVSGSGIGQLLTKEGVVPGSVDLIAPRGEVNAGDAGIRVAGNLNIAALRVIGADNISVGGVSTGVPAAPVSAFAGLGGLSSIASDAMRSVEKATQSLGSDSALGSKPPALSFISVEVLDLGDEGAAKSQSGNPK